MSARCEERNPGQIEWTDMFKRYMNHEGIVQAGDAEYVSKLDVGRIHATIFVTPDITPERLVRVSTNFIAFTIMRTTTIRNYHVSICDE